MSDEALVTIAFRDKGGSPAHILLPWQSGKRLRQYLRDPALRGFGLVHVAIRSRVLNQDRQKRRLTSVLAPGETVHVIKVARVGN